MPPGALLLSCCSMPQSLMPGHTQHSSTGRSVNATAPVVILHNLNKNLWHLFSYFSDVLHLIISANINTNYQIFISHNLKLLYCKQVYKYYTVNKFCLEFVCDHNVTPYKFKFIPSSIIYQSWPSIITIPKYYTFLKKRQAVYFKYHSAGFV